jgi:hypothetical protein
MNAEAYQGADDTSKCSTTNLLKKVQLISLLIVFGTKIVFYSQKNACAACGTLMKEASTAYDSGSNPYLLSILLPITWLKALEETVLKEAP